MQPKKFSNRSWFRCRVHRNLIEGCEIWIDFHSKNVPFSVVSRVFKHFKVEVTTFPVAGLFTCIFFVNERISFKQSQCFESFVMGRLCGFRF